MSTNEPQLTQLVRGLLPSGAELVMINKPAELTAVYAADLNGDQVPEVTAVYRLNGELYLLVLQYRDGIWEVAENEKGPGYGVTLLTAAPIMKPGKNNLIVGWQIGSIWSKLSVYTYTQDGLIDIAPPDMSYSYIRVMDMPSPAGRDGITEIALWIHDTGNAYRVEVLRWKNGRFVPAPDVYQYYFPTVVRYYEQMTQQHSDYSFYWYYLADAQYRAGMPQEALASVDKALSFEHPYPSRERLLELERNIRQMLDIIGMPRVVGLFPASLKTTEGMKWGYINNRGKMEIRSLYDDARDFQENGLAIVGVNGKYGIIDISTNYVVQPVYNMISPFSERRAIVIDGQGFKLIDETGTVLTKRAYPFIANMQDGRSVFNVTNVGNGGTSRYGYLNSQGNEVISAQYEEANDFENGRAVVKIKDNEYALIGRDGRKLATYPYTYVGPHGDGLLAFKREAAGKYGYDGRAVVNTAEDYKSNYGVINKQGMFVVKPEYNDIRDLGDERLALGRAVDPEQPFLGSKYAIADWKGTVLSEFVYQDVSNFQDDLASVSDTKQTYFIDRSGKPAPGFPRFSGSGTLTLVQKDLIKAFIDQRLSYVNRDGVVIWQQNTVIPLKSPFLVKEEKYKPNPDYLVYYPQVEGMTDKAAQQMVNSKLKEMSQVKPIPGKLDYSYSGDFEVAFYKQNLLELELNGYHYPFGAAHGMPTKTYAIINLVNGHMYTLKDLFKPGSDYVKELSSIVGKQIKEDPQYSYVFPGSYTGIRPDQPFFVTENAIHLYFSPYEIAPYAAGFPTFTIPFVEIRDIINTDGEFWKSFKV
ncbi:WG containing repeat-containing protein [Paenibacillus uliginis N3/975]|uniref:WG containing repeat-containing protein n=1 Tax=Paenibacillus uliginis N3/975 TaxID=1313296 RepID=A0A1X7HBY5_9BACL|nr:WG repeat-containing protein [Paenibacillus uliginis]SMF83671.1 WG containing repeat-containing protein [Paenibacillus uliginis N3/975]